MTFRWASGVRVAIGSTLGLVLLYCLLGIGITGPVSVGPERLDLDLNVSSENLRRDVRFLSEELAPRSYRQTTTLDRAAQWIATEFRAAGLQVEFQDYELTEGRYRNVIARQSGTDPGRSALVIGAHYDAYGDLPGADDNASGVAALLELVRTLPQTLPTRDRYFVAFSTEEPPFFGTEDMGSYRFAALLQRRDIEVNLMLSLDMVGYFSDEPGTQLIPSKLLQPLYPSQGDFIGVIGDWDQGPAIRRVKNGMRRARALRVLSFRAPASLAPVDLSDHLSFRRFGIPAVQITDTSFMRYAHYHRSTDTWDRLDYNKMRKVVQALHTLLWEP